EESRWLTRMISLSSVLSAASTAAKDRGRPTDKGVTRYGSRAVFFIGSSGKVWIFSLFTLILTSPPIKRIQSGLNQFRRGLKIKSAGNAVGADHATLMVFPPPLENQPGERRFHFALDGALQRARAVDGFVADLHQVGPGRGG